MSFSQSGVSVLFGCFGFDEDVAHHGQIAPMRGSLDRDQLDNAAGDNRGHIGEVFALP